MADDDIGDIEVLDHIDRLRQWRQQYPKRNYVGSQLVEVSGDLPRSQQKLTAGHVYSTRRAAGGTASGAPGAASGAPPKKKKKKPYYFEVVIVPFSQQVIPGSQDAVQRPDVPGDRYKIEPDLFQYTDRVSGQTHQHTTSIGRMMALATSHPLVAEGSTTCYLLQSSRDEQNKVDDEGRVTSGPSHVLSMSLVGTLKVFQVGLKTGPGPELFALHWTTQGKDWTQYSWLAARNVFFDIIELDASHFLPAPPRQPEFDVPLSDESSDSSSDDEKKRPGSSTSTSSESESESESSAGDNDEVAPERGEQAGAASGALHGATQQSELDAMYAEKDKVVVQRARTAIRQHQVHFGDTEWPEETYMWLEEAACVIERRKRLIKLFFELRRECATFPSEGAILTGIPHLNRAHPDTPFDVARAFSTHKLHYQAKLDTLLEHTGFDDMNCPFCRLWPNLHPVAGKVIHVDRRHPVWDVLHRDFDVDTIPKFLRHLFTKHDGEARLLGATSWTPMDTDVRHPKFWSYQFARSPEMRRWLYYRNKNKSLRTQWLEYSDVNWVLDQEGEDRTLLIRRVRAASGATALFEIITGGRVVTLAQMMCYGLNEKCTCFDVYSSYMDLPIVIHKRVHSEQGAPSRDAKRAKTA